MNEIAFFPWFKIDDQVQIGDFDLLIYDSQGSSKIQADLDNIIGDFYPFEERKVERCVLLKPKEKELGAEFSEEERRKIFMFSELLTFSGLAARSFFWGVMGGYSNKDVYQLVIRKYDGSSGGYRMTSRRRDGYTDTIVGKGATKIRKPKHIFSPIKKPINFNLLDALYFGSQNLSNDEWNPFYESIISFNLANTDSGYIREEMEIVLLFSSIERLFNVGKNTKKLYGFFKKTILPSKNSKPEMCERILKFKDESRFKEINTLRELWLRDFYNLRGNLAHGKYDHKYPSFWNMHEHLLFACFILPICLKVKLSDLELFELSEPDKDAIELFEELLSIHPFEITDDKNPWIDTFSEYNIKKSYKEYLDS